MTKRSKLVEVRWIDSAGTHGWQGTRKPDGKVLECWTVGHLIDRSKSALTLALNRDEQGCTGDWITIPLVCVRRVRRLR